MGYHDQITVHGFLAAGRYAIGVKVHWVKSDGSVLWQRAPLTVCSGPYDSVQDLLEATGEELFNIAPLMGEAGHAG